MLGFSFGLKGIAIASVVAFGLGGTLGWRASSKFSDAAHYKALSEAKDKRIATLEDRFKQLNSAAKNDQDRAAAAERQRAEAEGKANALQLLIVDGQCFSADDTRRLRGLWTGPLQRQRDRPAARQR